jgi:predicted HTH domain antitoxin
MMLFQEGKLTIGKAIQLSGLTRFEFEKALTKNNIPISNQSIEQVFSDMEKLSDL